MQRIEGLVPAPNWTSAAGALEGILAHAGIVLPRHAVMGLTGHAWHFCLGAEGGVVALPSGPAQFDRAAMVERYARTGLRFERFAAAAEGGRDAAVNWARERLDAGVPLIGWDFHLHEFGIVTGYDTDRGGFFVEDLLTEQVGAFVPWDAWPLLGWIELWAPIEPVEVEVPGVLVAALETAAALLDGREGDAEPGLLGWRGLEAWAEAFDGATEVDRAGNAYTLAVLQAARADGAAFLRDAASALPDARQAIEAAARALEEEVKALAPLITLFPFPTGGHGNVAVPGLRGSAAMVLRRAARHERECLAALDDALRLLNG
ncbi:hypothetical protein [Tepidiforma sp.]|uniref:hypothetical protein n=1 Tax=Tepidiforma sp. TaxID=2682230 RepID=UPI002ADD4CE1|nr:hypothetical protein [Tepidiforma sp.]